MISRREPQGVLLLVELQDAPATGAALPAQAEGRAQPAPLPAQQQQQQQGGGGGKGGGGGGGGVAPLIDREAAAFGALRRQWAYKLAKQAVDRFHELFAPYK
jgi:hypothetical protein